MPLPRRSSLTSLVLAALLAGCAPVQLAPQTAPDTPSAPAQTASPTPTPTPTPSPTPSPSPSPTPTIIPTDLMPGTNHNHAALAYAYPAAQVYDWLQGNVEPTEKVVFLTFDDGPNDSITPQVLDILAEYQVPATFFVVGNVIGDAPQMLERQIAEGHAIALHSNTHNYKKLYPGRHADADRVAQEFDETLALVREVVGPEFATATWRYPGGHMSWKSMEAADAALAERGASWIDWNSMTGDSEPESRRPTTVSGMVSMATAPIGQGFHVSVMLAHDAPGKHLTVESLPQIIQAYEDAGFSFGIIA